TLRATPFGTAIERKRWLKKLTMRAPFRPSLRFLYHYIWKQGFRDGYRGFVLCRLLASYERMIVVKEREFRKTRNGGCLTLNQ
ncbi:MAG: glycosyltransferase, partial [Verrucomicrobia bacterium]